VIRKLVWIKNQPHIAIPVSSAQRTANSCFLTGTWLNSQCECMCVTNEFPLEGLSVFFEVRWLLARDDFSLTVFGTRSCALSHFA
jgi:hypothetical protein